MPHSVPTDTLVDAGQDRSNRPSAFRFALRRAAALGILVSMALGSAYAALALTAPLDPAVVTIAAAADATAEPVSLEWPDASAGAIGRLGEPAPLAVHGTAEPVPIASITKVITALVVLDARPLTPRESGPSLAVGVAESALFAKYQRVNGKVEPMPLGAVLTERQLLEVTLISSANNYAEALAIWTFGSNDAFVAAARDWLDRHGLTATTIVEPTGMSPANTSSATDLLTLGELALAHPVMTEIVASGATTVPGVGPMLNSNVLLGIDGIDGIKTGTLDEAGACLLFSADLPVGDSTVPVVGVVLGATTHEVLANAVRRLIGQVTSGFRQVELVEPGEVFGTVDSEWGGSSAVVATGGATALVWSDTPISRSVDVPELPTTEVGSSAGTVTFTVDGVDYAVPLAFDSTVADPGPWWRLSNPALILPGN